MLENSLRKTSDEAGSMIALTYNRDITHKVESMMNILKIIKCKSRRYY